MDWTQFRQQLSAKYEDRPKVFARTYKSASVDVDNQSEPEQIKIESSKQVENTSKTTWDDLYNAINSPEEQTTVVTQSVNPIVAPSISVDKSKPRGYRNNNPLNIRISNNPWSGKVTDNTDGAFEQFVDIAHGYRAGLLNMRTQINRGNNTIRKLINIWAPASDNNNPERYANQVAAAAGMSVDDVINPRDPNTMQKIVAAMARVENGQDANLDEIAQGWKLYMGSTL